ncbi:VAMP-like protein ykt61 [Asimina triloba]
MKITALIVLRCSESSSGTEPIMLAHASDVSQFGYFQRPGVREFILFVGRTVAKRTPPGQRQSVQHEEYKVHSYNQNGLCVLGFMDDHYPVRSAFSVLNKDPAEADKLLKIQRDLDETKIILHKTIDSVLARGERLDSLVEKSSDLSAASQNIWVRSRPPNQTD